VTHRPISRQRQQHTRGQQYRNSVFCGPRTDRGYIMRAKHIFAYAVTSRNNREAVFSAVVRAELLKDNRRGVFHGVRATNSDTWHVFYMGSDPSLYNGSLLVARVIRGLELGVQKIQENGNTTAYNGVQQNGN
jgi:hypothetical protein